MKNVAIPFCNRLNFDRFVRQSKRALSHIFNTNLRSVLCTNLAFRAQSGKYFEQRADLDAAALVIALEINNNTNFLMFCVQLSQFRIYFCLLLTHVLIAECQAFQSAKAYFLFVYVTALCSNTLAVSKPVFSTKGTFFVKDETF